MFVILISLGIGMIWSPYFWRIVDPLINRFLSLEYEKKDFDCFDKGSQIVGGILVIFGLILLIFN